MDKLSKVLANSNPDKYRAEDDEAVEEEYETFIDRTDDCPAVQEGIDFINSVLEKGEPYCDPDFTPNLIPSYNFEDE